MMSIVIFLILCVQWSLADVTWEGSRFEFRSDLKTFAGAVNDCRDLDGRLAEVNDKILRQKLYEYAVGENYDKWGFWIGGSDAMKEGVWRWNASGAPVPYWGWKCGQPDDRFDNQDCMVIALGYNGKFDDSHCEKLFRYFCEFATSTVVTTTTAAPAPSTESSLPEVVTTTTRAPAPSTESSLPEAVTTTTAAPAPSTESSLPEDCILFVPTWHTDDKESTMVNLDTKETQVISFTNIAEEQPKNFDYQRCLGIVLASTDMTIFSVSMDTTDATELFTSEDALFGQIELDFHQQKVFFIDYYNGIGSFSYPDPTPDDPVYLVEQSFSENLNCPLELDTVNKVIFWRQRFIDIDDGTKRDGISKMSYNSRVPNLVLLPEPEEIPDFVVDRKGVKLYWTREFTDGGFNIGVLDLINGENEVLYTLTGSGGVTLQVVEEHLYVAVATSSKQGVYRMPTYGGPLEIVALKDEDVYMFTNMGSYCPGDCDAAPVPS